MGTSARHRHPWFALLGSLLILSGLIPVAPVAAVGLPVFINEIHYDNTGIDAGEAIEVAGPAGTDLTGWSIVLYNGTGGPVYDTDALSGTIPNEGGSGFGTVAITYPSNGIQNGAPDGIALVNAASSVVQFLSYEGAFTAIGGPANGMVSTDIGVSEVGTEALGTSLGLTGTGTNSEGFTWATGLAASFPGINPGQTFSTGDNAPAVDATDPADGAVDVAVGSDLSVTFSEAVNVSAGSFDLTCTDSAGHTLAITGGPVTFGLNPDADFVTDESCTLTVVAANVTDQDAADPPDTMAADVSATFAVEPSVSVPPVFINEIHYDNTGIDAGEAIEVAGPAGTDLTGWSIVLYNGTGGPVYDTDALSGTIPNEGGSGFGTVAITYPSNGIQNGAPDGIALVNAASSVVQFLSYEGAFTAIGGPANGMVSTDIGVSEVGTEALGTSLGLTGTGTNSEGFTWATGLAASFPGINPGQTFSTGDNAPTVDATDPADGAVDVAVGSDLSVTFSEAVNVSAGSFDLTCTDSAGHTLAITGGPVTFGLNPDADFVTDESCTLTVVAANVTDQDPADPPDTMAADVSATFATAASAPPDLVINEIDYDQPGTDATEFVEIRNSGESAANLDAVTVELVNGNLGGAVLYLAIDLPNVSLAAGGYFVICANPGTTPNCDLDAGADTNLIQNGDPDAIGLKAGGVLIDTASYGGNTGVPYTETSGVGLDDPQVDLKSLSRCPDGADTDVNNVDFVVRTSTPGSVNACLDDGPVVTSTTPAGGAIGVSVAADVSITFSESVDVTGSWFTITCTLSGAHAAAASGGPVTFDLNPDTDFANGESCTVTVHAANVTDQDGTDPPDNMPFDRVFSFAIAELAGCDAPPTHQISQVQGSGASTPLAGQSVRVEGVVTGDFQGAGQLGGFFLQDDSPDADPSTSDGLFALTNADVAVGDRVLVTGTAVEFFGLTELSPVTVLDVCGTGTIAPTVYDLPRPVGTTFEPVENILLTFPEALTATEHFLLGRFGEVTVSSDGRLFQPTDRVSPGLPAQAVLDEANRRRLLIDDGSTVENPAAVPYVTPEAVRIGDTATGVTGVLSFGFNLYRLQPTQTVTFTRTNPRPPAPEDVGGDVQVASFNTLNYFTTLADDNPDARGANDAEEFARQQAKEVAAILGIDADVLGLMEVENNGATAIGSLVDALNAATEPGTYAYVAEPVINPPNEFGGEFGTDAIKVAIVYKPGVVTPVGLALTSTDSIFDRPPLIQAFAPAGGGETFTIIVNHFKSKNCGGATGLDLDQGDGQACFNARRMSQAQALVALLDTLDVPNALVIGDLNSYTEEDPIHVFEDAGYVGLSEELMDDADRYSFVFDGFSGELDHGLAAPDLADNVTGATIWHINADEPVILDYNTEFNPPGLYQPDAFRTSDHDPLIIGLGLNETPTVDAGGPYSVFEGASVEVSATGSDPDEDLLVYAWDLDNNGTFETPGQSATFNALFDSAPANPTIRVQVTDPDGLTAVDETTVQIKWNFSGFLNPLSNPPIENVVKAGSGLPIKFLLSGDDGLGVIASGYPTSITYTCGATTRPLDGGTPTSVTPTGGFTFAAATGIYSYNWKTEKSWSGTCRRFILKLTDGTFHYADINFVK